MEKLSKPKNKTQRHNRWRETGKPYFKILATQNSKDQNKKVDKEQKKLTKVPDRNNTQNW